MLRSGEAVGESFSSILCVFRSFDWRKIALWRAPMQCLQSLIARSGPYLRHPSHLRVLYFKEEGLQKGHMGELEYIQAHHPRYIPFFSGQKSAF